MEWKLRQIAFYVRDARIINFFSGGNKSKKAEGLIKKYYDSLSEQEIKSLLDLYDEMNEDQRRKPSVLKYSNEG